MKLHGILPFRLVMHTTTGVATRYDEYRIDKGDGGPHPSWPKGSCIIGLRDPALWPKGSCSPVTVTPKKHTHGFAGNVVQS